MIDRDGRRRAIERLRLQIEMTEKTIIDHQAIIQRLMLECDELAAELRALEIGQRRE